MLFMNNEKFKYNSTKSMSWPPIISKHEVSP